MVDKLESFFLKIIRKIGLGKLANIYEKHKEGMRYIVFGVLTTLVSIVVSAFLYYLVLSNLNEELRVNVSTAISIVAAWIFAYITNKIYVFESKTKDLKELMQEIVSFVGCRFATAIIEMILMNLFVTILKFDYMLMKIIVNIIIIILNFVFSKLIIFKNNKEKGEVKNG